MGMAPHHFLTTLTSCGILPPHKYALCLFVEKGCGRQWSGYWWVCSAFYRIKKLTTCNLYDRGFSSFSCRDKKELCQGLHPRHPLLPLLLPSLRVMQSPLHLLLHLPYPNLLPLSTLTLTQTQTLALALHRLVPSPNLGRKSLLINPLWNKRQGPRSGSVLGL